MPLFLLSTGFIDDVTKELTVLSCSRNYLQFWKETLLPSAERELNIGYLMR